MNSKWTSAIFRDAAHKIADHNRIHSKKEPQAVLITKTLEDTVDLYTHLANGTLSLVGQTENISAVSHCDKFICRKCGICLQDWVKVEPEEYEDGYIDYTHHEYEFKFCPECGSKILADYKEGIK